MISRYALVFATLATGVAGFLSRAAAELPDAAVCTSLRMPSVPLVTHDPYFSVWSSSDTLNTAWSQHWTGTTQALAGLLRVDGKTYAFLGDPKTPGVLRAKQTALRVSATRTAYVFEAGGVTLEFTFTSPLLIDDPDTLSRPATYLGANLVASDGGTHDVALYLDATGEWAVNAAGDPVRTEDLSTRATLIPAVGADPQKVLARKGDNLRIEWGRLLLGARRAGATACTGDVEASRKTFSGEGKLPASESGAARPANDRWPGVSLCFAGTKVGAQPVGRLAVIGYFDDVSIRYFGKNLRVWWNREGKKTPADLIEESLADHDAVLARCVATDGLIAGDSVKAGGRKYADLCIAAYRQAIAAHKAVAAPDGKLLFLSKENFSNGSIGTVDVTYPSFPLFAAYGPQLAQGLLNPIFDYCESGRWKKPFPPHDLGTYPIADGQTYPKDMPVEEAGNMLLCAAATLRQPGAVPYLESHYAVMRGWADYLVKDGLDPALQLCTDDFAGHLARNANLSVKAIVGVGALALVAEKTGHAEDARTYRDKALAMARRWPALAADGDHTVLAFGKPGTWSMKYNLVWDKVLDLRLFDPALARSEIAYYLKQGNAYGLPLDNRKDYTKSDWIMWTAAMAGDARDFEALVDPVWKFADETPSRVPLSDWHGTKSGKSVGFRARSVVGGYFMKVLGMKNREEPSP